MRILGYIFLSLVVLYACVSVISLIRAFRERNKRLHENFHESDDLTDDNVIVADSSNDVDNVDSTD